MQTETKPTKYSGAEWLDAELSPLGRKVADILGQVWGGIYHIDNRWLRRVNWKHAWVVEITLREEMSTYDPDRLTRLVALCHDAAVRMNIRAATHGYLTLTFHQRQRDGVLCERHPTMEAAIESIRKQISTPAVRYAD